MVKPYVMSGASPSQTSPVVRKIGMADVRDAVAKGIDDFAAMPTHVLPLSIIYPLVGLLLACLTFGHDVMPIFFPLAAGFALIGPFAAVSLYELSRRREQGLDVSWDDTFAVLRCPSLDAIAALGFILTIVFVIWIAIALILYRSLFGLAAPASLGQFLSDVFTTSKGWMLIAVGSGIGLLFAGLVLTISVVSFPLLLDRDIGLLLAVRTSARAVFLNPLPMATWGLIVAVALLLGSLPLFVGLAVVIPILAHATWHLYRKVVDPEPGSRHERERPEARKRYAADLPSVLLPWSRKDTP